MHLGWVGLSGHENLVAQQTSPTYENGLIASAFQPQELPVFPIRFAIVAGLAQRIAPRVRNDRTASLYHHGEMASASLSEVDIGHIRDPSTLPEESVGSHNDAFIIHHCFSYEDSPLVPLHFLPAGSY